MRPGLSDRQRAILGRIPMRDCRDCAAPIRFVRLNTDRTIPVNPLPDRAGNVFARKIGGSLHGYVVAKDAADDPLFVRLMPHAATCEAIERPEPTAPDPALFNL